MQTLKKTPLCFIFRYGLPVNFQAMLLQPNKRTMKKLREVLYDLYKHLDSSAAAIIDVSDVLHSLCSLWIQVLTQYR